MTTATRSKLLFLDVDGVLNDHSFDPETLCGQIHREKVALLNGVLRATGANVVLSSAWRYIVYRGEASLAGMDWLFRSHGMLANRLVGITRKDTMRATDAYDGKPGSWPVANERGAQITDWLRENGGDSATAYAVVDDLDLGISDAGHPFVQTNGAVGLTEANAAQLVALLNQTSAREAA